MRLWGGGGGWCGAGRSGNWSCRDFGSRSTGCGCRENCRSSGIQNRTESRQFPDGRRENCSSPGIHHKTESGQFVDAAQTKTGIRTKSASGRMPFTQRNSITPTLSFTRWFLKDFELSAINAFETEFPNANVTGVFFTSLRISTGTCAGSMDFGYNDHPFALSMCMLAALAFVPPHRVEEYF